MFFIALGINPSVSSDLKTSWLNLSYTPAIVYVFPLPVWPYANIVTE